MKLKTNCTTRLCRLIRKFLLKVGYPFDLLHLHAFDSYICLASLPANRHEAELSLYKGLPVLG
jgi:hypothetical protein